MPTKPASEIVCRVQSSIAMGARSLPPRHGTPSLRPRDWAAAVLAVVVILCSGGKASAARAGDSKPNIVFILTDNQAAWTLGCYGNPDIKTPNIDRLAEEGARFTRSFASNAVCSPTRATLLTGLIPSQHGVHSYLGAGKAQMGPKAYNTIAEFRSLPEILSEAGYTCGLSGKWHLGDNLHPQDGFTTWTTLPHGHTTTFYDAEIIDGGKVREEPEYLTEFWTDRGVDFIKAQAKSDKPFFLFLAYNGPYGLGESMSKPARNRHADYYANKELASFPREPMHPWQAGNKSLHNNPSAMRRYAAEVSGVDDGVGRIMQTLEDQGLDDNTLVIFTADQGLAAGHHGLWAMGDHTRPLTAFDPMIHTPLIFRQPGRIEAGVTPDYLVSNYDFLPSLLDYLGLKAATPTTPPLPGRSYANALRGESLDWKNEMFFEYENTRMIRTDEWKYITRFPDGPEELYDLKSDPGERQNLADAPAHAKTQADLTARLEAFFGKYVDPQYDLAHGGKSKADRRLKPTQVKRGR
jgi:arylsulfatase A-like enzyme